MESLVEIIPVRSRKELRDFIEVPFQLYQGNPYWIAPLRMSIRETFDRKKNPFWKTADFTQYLVRKKGKVVGRFVVIENQSLPAEARDLHFGFLDFTDDPEVTQSIFTFLKNTAQEKNYNSLTGPFNPGINYEMGVLLEGFEMPAAIMMTYNAPYYARHYEANGFTEAMRFFSYRLPVADFRETPQLQRIQHRIATRNSCRIEEVNYRDLAGESSILCEVYNDAFSHHWGSSPLLREEFEAMARQMMMFMNRQLLFKLCIENETVAFILALPDFNEALSHLPEGRLLPTGFLKLLYYQRKIRNVKVLVTAIRQRYQNLGLGALLYSEMYRRVKAGGYESGELSWVAEDNHAMQSAILAMGGIQEKTYGVYRFSNAP